MAAADPLDDAWNAAMTRERRLAWLTARDAGECKRALAQLAAEGANTTENAHDRLRKARDARHVSAEELRELATLKVPADLARIATREAERLDVLGAFVDRGRPPVAVQVRHVYLVRPAPPMGHEREGGPRWTRWRDGIIGTFTWEEVKLVGGRATLVWIDPTRFHTDSSTKVKLDAAVTLRLTSGPPRDEVRSYLEDRLLAAAVDSAALAPSEPIMSKALDEDVAAMARQAPPRDAKALVREAQTLADETGRAAVLGAREGRKDVAADFQRWQEHARSFTLRP